MLSHKEGKGHLIQTIYYFFELKKDCVNMKQKVLTYNCIVLGEETFCRKTVL